MASASGGGGSARTIPNGPEADYPVVIGEPFTVDGITYTPSDSMNYDEVGYATLDEDGATGITVSHRTLPLPSYVEITDLESGRTILARVERRGPMTNARLVALSPAALTQLGAREGTPVRVRRVNPPEDQRAELRADAEAPLRMETPEGLLAVLRRNLPAVGSASLAASRENGTADVGKSDAIASVDPDTGQAATDFALDDGVTLSDAEPQPSVSAQPDPVPEPAAEPSAEPASAADAIPNTSAGDWIVQAGAFSAKSTAERIAREIGGFVEPVGRLWRVRSGPYATRGQADAALAKVRGAGYRAAQVYPIR
ncbi:SPOR domain-containing protein [Qipengyuania sp. MTN3-11]|uniref:SPOR domain-containing protein n=1 Tax=Qipengyuania sp. MTN3-11 TaxID=3056557 RepID=UPI0036F2670E